MKNDSSAVTDPMGDKAALAKVTSMITEHDETGAVVEPTPEPTPEPVEAAADTPSTLTAPLKWEVQAPADLPAEGRAEFEKLARLDEAWRDPLVFEQRRAAIAKHVQDNYGKPGLAKLARVNDYEVIDALWGRIEQQQQRAPVAPREDPNAKVRARQEARRETQRAIRGVRDMTTARELFAQSNLTDPQE